MVRLMANIGIDEKLMVILAQRIDGPKRYKLAMSLSSDCMLDCL